MILNRGSIRGDSLFLFEGMSGFISECTIDSSQRCTGDNHIQSSVKERVFGYVNSPLLPEAARMRGHAT